MEKSTGITLRMLGIAFVVLKLTGFIDWSWWLVTLPFYGAFALAAIVYLIIIFIEKINE